MKNKKDVCVDLDGVLADYEEGWKGSDHIGYPIPGAVDFVKELSSFCKVIIHTSRSSIPGVLDSIKNWLDTHGFEYDSIWEGEGKPIASAYVDDRAVLCDPQDLHGLSGFSGYDVAVQECKVLCEED